MTKITDQLALEFGLAPADFARPYNRFITAPPVSGARYWARDAGDLVVYQDHLYVRTTNPLVTDGIALDFNTTAGEWFFAWPHLRELERLLHRYGWQITNHAPFFLPTGTIQPPSDAHLMLIEQADIPLFKKDKRIHEAFAFDDVDPDMLGVGYFDDGQLKVVAGANQNGRYTWEIGVEVLDPAFARQGLAVKVVQLLTAEIQRREPEMLVVYGTQFSHMRSMNVAIRAGFKVGWTELTFAPIRRHH
ncbi:MULTISPECIES: GNAT family N-acetyltransferase [unclassified Lacticaseibacillus]|uniref:GNAT family N-acetyltransferase n=1 Tax=unclassified Lacticaseibacillus TaxID=2759744 RepID=UPI0019440E6B|nr:MULTISPECIES: GNAT family N-acetyltransferase [unclassified Lacticaseibacillus]